MRAGTSFFKKASARRNAASAISAATGKSLRSAGTPAVAATMRSQTLFAAATSSAETPSVSCGNASALAKNSSRIRLRFVIFFAKKSSSFPKSKSSSAKSASGSASARNVCANSAPVRGAGTPQVSAAQAMSGSRFAACGLW